jgi:hypothetical protein
MKIYRCDKYDAHLGRLVSWHASRREAERVLREFQRERDDSSVGPESVEEVQFPTNKEGLLIWLNSNLNTDNG